MSSLPPDQTVFVPNPLPSELIGDQDIDKLDVKLLLKRYLPGLVLRGPDGEEFPQEFWEWKLKSARDRFERYTQILLTERQINAEPHDYNAIDFATWGWIQLYQYPVTNVSEIRAEYPTSETITIFPSVWIRVRMEHGQLQLVPTSGTLSNVLIGRGGSYLGLLRYKTSSLPDLFKVTYTAGLAKGQVPASIVDAVGKLTMIEALTDIGDSLLGPGVQSISVGLDGLSQSIGFSNVQEGGIFAARVNSYLRDLFGRQEFRGTPGTRGMLNILRDFFKGPTIVSA
jgi:hypothetical protein